MYKISLLDINDLEEAYEIEVLTNPSPWSIDNFKSSFEVGHHGLVCKEDNKMLGFLIFSPIKPEAHLLSIAVIETQQYKGIGSLLLKSMVSQCKAMGINQVFLEVRASNEKAIGFYQKYGFKKDAIRENYYSGDIPEDALLMSLGL
ncbi:ribosomal protein S18-alanine N-acetyltransferase [Gammaproteobacteria bacterium]|jgi:ribosomal-protein-alanine N-acetyltransferase|nr:ribosomal protein S18-alanine N-acetyltransferase [Gammaproteobacteria bacterium]MDA7735015.1 ribosomal protein S18-alanine N-acetyltransferase [Gammaproteobacteria bacterium]MDA7800137.1 ribosomal protein S18-alanine N-acetyltransferase [Gammaproteobacteria bacterium]MDA7821334.1 ribosomal protein S18-alanine N-acetyltransferase [Gammaproteobacteria bacterium]MDA8674287.1 ribosomal protein S18-alanine N-acetyltransferase [Gammaproteobacteria bacterium]|tara:strand:- start:177 stop:614 length:438 start_codon:yes stop_codon:yes gene_type:complete